MKGARGAVPAFVLCCTMASAQASWIAPFISEIHYDNLGADVGEFVAVTGPAEIDLTGWELVLYNGANGRPYRTVALTGLAGPRGLGWRESAWSVSGIQNGPDAVALVSPQIGLVDFVAYEGLVVASGGAADGRQARPLPVRQAGTEPPGVSLQRVGRASDWDWLLQPASAGRLNAGLQLPSPAAVPSLPVGLLWVAGLVGWGALAGRRSGAARQRRR